MLIDDLQALATDLELRAKTAPTPDLASNAERLHRHVRAYVAEDWQLHWSAEGSGGVRIRTSGVSAPGEQFIIDALDTEQGYGG